MNSMLHRYLPITILALIIVLTSQQVFAQENIDKTKNNIPTTIQVAKALNNDSVLVGTKDGLYMYSSNGRKWDRLNFPGKSILTITTTTHGIVYVSTSGLGLYKSIDTRFTSWVELIKPSTMRSELDNHWNFCLDKNNTIYISCYGKGVMYSEDEGKSWEQTNNGLKDFDVTCLALSVDDILYAGTDSFGVLRFNKSNQIWEPLSDNNTQVPSVSTVKLLHNGTILAGCSSEIYSLTPNSKIWKMNALFNTQPTTLNNQVRHLFYDNENVIHAATTQGIYCSTDAGITWSKNTSTLLQTPILSITGNNKFMYVYSQNEIEHYSFSTSKTGIDYTTNNSANTLIVTALNSDILTISCINPNVIIEQIHIYTLNGSLLHTSNNSHGNTNSWTVNTSLWSSGVYYGKVVTNGVTYFVTLYKD